uniref:Uncharacterized protein n=1 Tax=Tetranychus urticae TaxID=32264 RepID=T1L4D9_TETUR
MVTPVKLTKKGFNQKFRFDKEKGIGLILDQRWKWDDRYLN